MRDWYGGRRVDPLDRMDRDALKMMLGDAKEAHADVTTWRDEAVAAGQEMRAYVMTQERKRLAGIWSEIKCRL